MRASGCGPTCHRRALDEEEPQVQDRPVDQQCGPEARPAHGEQRGAPASPDPIRRRQGAEHTAAQQQLAPWPRQQSRPPRRQYHRCPDTSGHEAERFPRFLHHRALSAPFMEWDRPPVVEYQREQA